MKQKLGRNDLCPCGSAKKTKKCCGKPGVAAFAQSDRGSAWEKLERIREELGDEDDLAGEEFWGRWLDERDDLPEEIALQCEVMADSWFFFDRELADGGRVVDRLPTSDRRCTPGEREYLKQMRESTLRLWEVIDVVPGLTLTLRDVLEDTRVVVKDESPQGLPLHEMLAARLVSRGVSGAAEIEPGLIAVPPWLRQPLSGQLREQRAQYLRDDPDQDLIRFYETLPPIVLDLWMSAHYERDEPALGDTDGDSAR